MSENFYEKFEKLFTTGEYSDFVITVNGSKDFKVHRAFLAAQSESFAELFTKANEATKMEIGDFSVDAVEKFLKFFYIGTIKTSSKSALEIFSLASKFKVLYLKDAIRKFIIDNIADFDALEVFKLASTFKLYGMRRAAFEAIEENLKLKLQPNHIDDLEKVSEIVETSRKFQSLLISE